MLYLQVLNIGKQEALRERKPAPGLVCGARNSLFSWETVWPIPSCVHILNISWISIPLLFHWYQIQTQKIENEPCIQGVKHTIPNMYQIVPHVITNLSWQFHKKSIHPFYRNIAHIHTCVPRWETAKQSSQTWKKIDNYFCVMPDISWKFHENPLTRFSMILLTNTDPGNKTKKPILFSRG